MKTLIRTFISKLVANPYFWTASKRTIIRLADAIKAARHRLDSSTEMALNSLQISPDLKVLRGKFEGMVYPQAIACGSALPPKLIGSYEGELDQVMETIIQLTPERIYDIGCAEGFYAVGLAMRLPKTKIHAFDTDSVARRACSALAKRNNVTQNLMISEGVEKVDILAWNDECVIISDCEGYEGCLFDEKVAIRHSRSYFLIEIHDIVDPEISVSLKAAFSATHKIDVIESIDDLKKVDLYEFPELRGMSRAKRLQILTERRPCLMTWFWCMPKDL